MEKQIAGHKTMRRGEAHLPAATDMSANTPTVTSLLHKHAGGRRRMQSRFRWDRAPKRAWELRSLSSNGKASHTEAEAFVLSWSSSQCHLTKEQCFQWAGLTRSEHIIGPFLGLHATRLSHRSLRQGAEHLAEGPRPIGSGLSIGPSTGSMQPQCNHLASHRKMPRGAGSGPCPAPRSKRHLSKWPAEPQRELDETAILTRPRRKGGERFDHQR
jgi:hypothetical protein